MESIPEIAQIIPEETLVTFLSDEALEQHIQLRHRQQAEAIDNFIDSKKRTDEEFHSIDTPSHNYMVSIREEARRSKAKRTGKRIVDIVRTEKL